MRLGNNYLGGLNWVIWSDYLKLKPMPIAEWNAKSDEEKKKLASVGAGGAGARPRAAARGKPARAPSPSRACHPSPAWPSLASCAPLATRSGLPGPACT